MASNRVVAFQLNLSERMIDETEIHVSPHLLSRCLCGRFTAHVSMNLLERMGQYLIWADKTIWNIVQGLSEKEFQKTLGEGGGSIRKRYIHLAQDTWEWYHDWVDKVPEDEPDFDKMGRDALFKFLTDHVNEFLKMIDERTVDKITFVRKGIDITISFDEILFHLVNHAAYHRGQIVMGLRLLGKEIQMTDYVPYRIATA